MISYYKALRAQRWNILKASSTGTNSIESIYTIWNLEQEKYGIRDKQSEPN